MLQLRGFGFNLLSGGWDSLNFPRRCPSQSAVAIAQRTIFLLLPRNEASPPYVSNKLSPAHSRLIMQASMRMLFSFWPGTLTAWRLGDARSLLVAIAFGLIVCTAWVGSTIWPMWLDPWKIWALWCLVAAGALASCAHNAMTGLLSRPKNHIGCPIDQWTLAQEHYLQANYFEAERILQPFAFGKTTDVEAGLLLSSIMRRTERYQQSMELLDQLALLDDAWKWHEEIAKEKRLALQQKVRAHTESL